MLIGDNMVSPSNNKIFKSADDLNLDPITAKTLKSGIKEVKASTRRFSDRLFQQNDLLSKVFLSIRAGKPQLDQIDQIDSQTVSLLEEAKRELTKLQADLAPLEGSKESLEIEKELIRNLELVDFLTRKHQLLTEMRDPDLVKTFQLKKQLDGILNKVKDPADFENISQIYQQIPKGLGKSSFIQSEIKQARAYIDRKITVLSDEALQLTAEEERLVQQIDEGRIPPKTKVKVVASLLKKKCVSYLYFTDSAKAAAQKNEVKKLIGVVKGQQVLWDQVKTQPHLNELITAVQSSNLPILMVDKVHVKPILEDAHNPNLERDITDKLIFSKKDSLATVQLNPIVRFFQWIFNRRAMKVAAETETVALRTLKLKKYVEDELQKLKDGNLQRPTREELAALDVMIANQEKSLKIRELDNASLGRNGLSRKIHKLLDKQRLVLESLKNKRVLLGETNKDPLTEAYVASRTIDNALEKARKNPSSAGADLFTSIQRLKEFERLAEQHKRDPLIGNHIWQMALASREKVVGLYKQGYANMPGKHKQLKSEFIALGSVARQTSLAQRKGNDRKFAEMLAFEITEALYFTKSENKPQKLQDIESFILALQQHRGLWASIQSQAELNMSKLLTEYRNERQSPQAATLAQLKNSFDSYLAEAEIHKVQAPSLMFKARNALSEMRRMHEQAADGVFKDNLRDLIALKQEAWNQNLALCNLKKFDRKLLDTVSRREISPDLRAVGRLKLALEKSMLLALNEGKKDDLQNAVKLLINVYCSKVDHENWNTLIGDATFKEMVDAIRPRLLEIVDNSRNPFDPSKAMELGKMIRDVYALTYISGVNLTVEQSDMLSSATKLALNPELKREALDNNKMNNIIVEMKNTSAKYVKDLDRNLIFLQNPEFINLFKNNEKETIRQFAVQFAEHRTHADNLDKLIKKLAGNNAPVQFVQIISSSKEFADYAASAVALASKGDELVTITNRYFGEDGTFEKWFQKPENAALRASMKEMYNMTSAKDDTHLSFRMIAVQRFLKLPLATLDMLKDYEKASLDIKPFVVAKQKLDFLSDRMNKGRR